MFSLVSVKQAVHVGICNWKTFRTIALLHMLVRLMENFGWREGGEIVWPVKTSKLLSPAEERSRLLLVSSGANASCQQGRVDRMNTKRGD